MLDESLDDVSFGHFALGDHHHHVQMLRLQKVPGKYGLSIAHGMPVRFQDVINKCCLMMLPIYKVILDSFHV